MVEGSPRRVTVAEHDSSVKIPLDLSEDNDDKLHPKFDNFQKHETEPSDGSPGGSRWRKLRTTVQLGNAVTHHRKPPLKREDSFLKRFSTRPPNIILCDKDPAKADNWVYRLARATVLNPDESLKFWWLWLVTFCGLYNSWTLIVRQAFPELQEAHTVLWKVLDWCSDVVYFLDIAVQFRTGYLEQGIMVRDATQLAKHYVMSRDFFLDVVALLPLSYIPGLGESPLLRFPRFLKARRIYKFYYAVESRTAYPNLWRVANLIHVLLLLAHWFGCFYYMLSELEGFKGNWAYRHPDLPENEHSPLVRKYLGSVYWSTLTLTTIGDLATPATNLQYLFTIISYLIGVFIFATIVGQVGNVITNRNASRLEFERLLDGAKMYMRHHKVPKGMQRRVQRWYDYSWSRGRMQGGGDIHSALGILPDKLKTELAIHVNLKTLKKVSIFKECQPEFLHDLVLKMKAYIFTPGDLVCRKGEVAREMFIIADGILQVINDKGQVLTHMRAGDFFGEIGILNLDGFNRRTADVRSVGYSELFSLSREDVLSAMKDYPEAEEILQSMGRRRLMEARLASPSDKSLFHEDSDSSKGKNEARQRKMGMSLAYLLRKKETQYDATNFHTQKFTNASLNTNKLLDKIVTTSVETSKIETNQSALIQLNHVELKPPHSADKTNTNDSQSPKNLVEQITSKLKKHNKVPHFRVRRKHSWWNKIYHLVHLRRKAIVSTTLKHSEVQQTSEEPKMNRDTKSDVLLKPENLGLQNNNRSVSGSGRENSGRRKSWQLSKPSVSNWTRSELIAPPTVKVNAKTVRSRRKTLSDGMLFSSNFKPFSSHEKVPGILMTGSDLNCNEVSPDISPMSSNYSLTPSTTDEEDMEDTLGEARQSATHKVTLQSHSTLSEVTELPLEVKEMIASIVSGIKDKVNSIIVQSEKNTILEIIELRERIKQQDALIQFLEEQCSHQAVKEHKEATRPKEIKLTISPAKESSPANRQSGDSAICSIETPSPSDLSPGVKFEEEDMWLVEFPSNLNLAAIETSSETKKHPKIRRHSSVEVGRELPFRLAVQKTQNNFLSPNIHNEDPPSPRRFSESQLRADDVPINKSFAAKVRRVLAKVKVNKEMEDKLTLESDAPPIKWPHLTKKDSKASRRSSTGSASDKMSSIFFQSRPSSSSQSKRSQDKDTSGDIRGKTATRHGSDGRPVPKRILPTITESCSFDSLRDSPLMTHISTPPVSSMPNLENMESSNFSTTIDMPDADELCMVELPRK